MTDALLPCARAPLTVRARPISAKIDVLIDGRAFAKVTYRRDSRSHSKTEILIGDQLLIVTWDPDLRLLHHSDGTGAVVHSQEIIDAPGAIPKISEWTYACGVMAVAKAGCRDFCGLECEEFELIDQHENYRGELWVSLENGLVLFERQRDLSGRERIWTITHLS